MPLDSTQLAQAAADLKRDVLEDIAGDKAAPPEHTLELARILLETPWVPDFLMPLITPVKGNLRSYFKLSVMRVGERVWHFPSFHWFRNHARICHGPDGSGFDLAEHVKHLGEESLEASFLQANLLKDGRLHILGEDDFKMEAGFWKANTSRFIESR